MLGLFDSTEVADGEQVRSLRRRSLGRAALDWLCDSDRTIFELAEQGIGLRVIGRAVSLNQGTVCRRLARVRRRLASPLVQTLLVPDSPVPETCRKIALLNRLSGRSIPDIARTLGLTESAVREHVRFACGIVQGMLRRNSV